MSKKIETKIERLRRLTKKYSLAAKKNVWRTERRFCDEIQQAVRNMGLTYKPNRIIKDGSRTFCMAILQQLRRKDIFYNLSDDMKKLSDNMDPVELRGRVCNFLEFSDNIQVQLLREKFDMKLQMDITWEDYWKHQRNKETIPSLWFIMATALFLNIDIMLVTIPDEKEVLPFIQELSGNLEKPDEVLSNCPLVLGNNCYHYYVSLHLEKNGEKLKKENVEKYQEKIFEKEDQERILKIKSTENCPYCDRKFQRLLRHLSSPGPCKDNSSDEIIQELKLKAKANHKASKAKSQKLIQTHESLEKREDRLAMHSYYMMKKRMKDKKGKEKFSFVKKPSEKKDMAK